MNNPAIIVDLDGTLADNQVRATAKMKHWKDYWPLYKHIPEDKINESIKDLIFNYLGHRIILLTGRPEKFYNETMNWLDTHLRLSINHRAKLIMMPNDYPEEKSDTDFKEEKLLELMKHYDVRLAVDDSQKNCEMFRKHGIPTLKVMK